MAKLMTMVLAGVLLASLGERVAATTQDDIDRTPGAALKAFEERIDEYVVLRKQAEARLSPFVPSEDPQTFLRQRAALAAGIKAARPISGQHDIFTPAVERLFRGRIAQALAGRDVESLLRDLFAEHAVVESFHPRVYENYPEWATHEVPVVLVKHLPALPDDVEYRLIGHDLVLWDVLADLILDVLPGAIPHQMT
jgi:hypothetical protein